MKSYAITLDFSLKIISLHSMLTILWFRFRSLTLLANDPYLSSRVTWSSFAAEHDLPQDSGRPREGGGWLVEVFMSDHTIIH